MSDELQIRYTGPRWQACGRFLASRNADLAARFRRKTWEKNKFGDPTWADLQQAMRQPFLDPLVVAMSDMLGEPYDALRVDFLQYIRQLVCNGIPYGQRSRIMLDVPGGYFEAMLRIDPLLAAWFVANFFASSLKQAQGAAGVIGCGFIEAGLVAQRLLSSFGLSAQAAESAVKTVYDRVISRADAGDPWPPTERRSPKIMSFRSLTDAVDKYVEESVKCSWYIRCTSGDSGPHIIVDRNDTTKIVRNLVIQQYRNMYYAGEEMTEAVELLTQREFRQLGWLAAHDALVAYPPTPVIDPA